MIYINYHPGDPIAIIIIIITTIDIVIRDLTVVEFSLKMLKYRKRDWIFRPTSS